MKNFFTHTLLFFSLSLAAQQGWDLQQCIDYAIKHNLSLRQAALNNEVNKNNTTQSKVGLLPSINAAATNVYNFGQTIDKYTNQFATTEVLSQNFYLSSQTTLWSGLAQYNTIKSNEYNYLSGVERVKQQQNDLSLSVANAYINVIFTDELSKISQNQYKISQEQYERTKKLVDAGTMAKSNEYDIKAQLANDEVNMTTADNNYQLATLSLKQLMNFDSITNFIIARPDLGSTENQLLENNITAMYETAVRNQPGVKSNEYAVMSANKYLAAARGKRSPTLTFNANLATGFSGLAKKVTGYNITTNTLVTDVGTFHYNTPQPILTDKPFSEQFNDNINKSLGFTFSLPIFNGLQTHTAIKNAQINILNNKFSTDITKQTLYKNIVQAHANAKAALNKYNATKSSVEAAGESYKYAEQKFNAGVISAFEFNSAKNRLFAAQSNMTQAKYDYVFKLKVLDYYQGKPLGF